MIEYKISGRDTILAQHLVLDYNGTIAFEGKLINEVEYLLNTLSDKLDIHIVTADTFGTVKKELQNVSCTIDIIGDENQDVQKSNIVDSLGNEKVIAIGNGRNDALMLERSALGIMTIQQEGAFSKLFNYSDIVCNNIIDALKILLNAKQINATLRN